MSDPCVSDSAESLPCHTGLVKRWWHVPKFSLRSVDVAQRLDTFLVCAIGAVLGNRFFLILTGYPQLGNGTLHISHAIWGALMMAVAIIFAISFLAPNNRTFIAFIGGCGFGWFIDELGKFITRDVNYFFQPTIALIYIVFQRYNSSLSRWVSVKRVYLRATSGTTPLVVTSATFRAKVKARLRVRGFMPQAQVGACYAAGIGNVIRS